MKLSDFLTEEFKTVSSKDSAGKEHIKTFLNGVRTPFDIYLKTLDDAFEMIGDTIYEKFPKTNLIKELSFFNRFIEIGSTAEDERNRLIDAQLDPKQYDLSKEQSSKMLKDLDEYEKTYNPIHLHSTLKKIIDRELGQGNVIMYFPMPTDTGEENLKRVYERGLRNYNLYKINDHTFIISKKEEK